MLHRHTMLVQVSHGGGIDRKPTGEGNALSAESWQALSHDDFDVGEGDAGGLEGVHYAAG